MKDHGYSKQEVEFICKKIEAWIAGVEPLSKPEAYYYFGCCKQYYEGVHQYLAPKEPLQITFTYFDPNRKDRMVIYRYEGALRVYKFLTGKKPIGFEHFGKEIYY